MPHDSDRGEQPDVEIVEIVDRNTADQGLVKVARNVDQAIYINGRPIGYFNDLEVSVVGDECVSVRLTLFPRNLVVRHQVRGESCGCPEGTLDPADERLCATCRSRVAAKTNITVQVHPSVADAAIAEHLSRMLRSR